MKAGAYAIAGLSALASLAAAPPPGPVHLTLEESVHTALSSSTPVLKAQNDAEAAGAQLLQGYAQFLPTLDTSLTYDYRSGTSIYALANVTSVYSRNRGSNFVVTSTLNLFNGFSDYGALKAALARKSTSQLNLDFAREQIALDVTQSYLQVILDQDLVQIAAHNLEASTARLKLLRAQTAVGQTSPADLQRQEAQRAADDQALTNSEVRAHDDQLLLIRKLRLDPARDYELEAPPLEVPAGGLASRGEEELIRLALAQRKDLASSESLLEATQWDVTRAKSDYYPKLDFNFLRLAGGRYIIDQSIGGADYTPSFQYGLIPQLGNQVLYDFTLTLSWNLFDRLLTRTAVTRASLASQNTRLDAEDARLKVVADVRQVRGDFAASQRQVQSSREGVRAAQDALNTIEGRYRVGASSFIDVLAAQSALVSAQAAEAQAVINLKLQEKLLQFVTGTI